MLENRLWAAGAVRGPEAACGPNDGHCESNGLEDAAVAEFLLSPEDSSLAPVSSQTFEGDGTDAFLTAAHDGLETLYLGGFSQSATFEGVPVTGEKDGVVVALTTGAVR